MPVVKSEFPILEYDTEPRGVIMPNRRGEARLPDRCVLTFFAEALLAFAEKTGARKAGEYVSEMGLFPVYEFDYRGAPMCAAQALVGSANIAGMSDWLFARGVKTLIACGGCGVLREIPRGDVIIPVRALRDEGASYHYLPPSREISLDPGVLGVLRATLNEFGVPYVEAMTWTTDAFFRETPDMVAYRREEGCDVVEMECATLACVAKFRGARFGQLLYSGDTLADFENYDDRGWMENLSARERLFYLALEAAARA